MLNPIKIRSEELNKRVTILKSVAAKNSHGTVIYEYSTDDVENVCASIEPYSAHIVKGVAEITADVEFRITIRYRKNLNLHDRIIYQGRIFEQTVPARDINEQHKFLQLTCREKITVNL